MKTSNLCSLVLMVLALTRFFTENKHGRDELGIAALVALAGFIAAEIVEQHDKREGKE
jgi:hypothetical protein